MSAEEMCGEDSCVCHGFRVRSVATCLDKNSGSSGSSNKLTVLSSRFPLFSDDPADLHPACRRPSGWIREVEVDKDDDVVAVEEVERFSLPKVNITWSKEKGEGGEVRDFSYSCSSMFYSGALNCLIFSNW